MIDKIGMATGDDFDFDVWEPYPYMDTIELDDALQSVAA